MSTTLAAVPWQVVPSATITTPMSFVAAFVPLASGTGGTIAVVLEALLVTSVVNLGAGIGCLLL